MSEQFADKRSELRTHAPTEFEENLREWVDELAAPLWTAVTEEYPDRGLFVCGPTSIALSRLMHAQTGIPIGRQGTDEHLELAMGFFDPANQVYEPSDHVHLRYHDGQGLVYFIDAVYNQLWPGIADSKQPILINAFPADTIDADLQQQYGLYPLSHFAQVQPRLGPFDPWGEGEALSMDVFDEFVGLLHQPDITDDLVLTNRGNVRNVASFFGGRTARVINRATQLLG